MPCWKSTLPDLRPLLRFWAVLAVWLACVGSASAGGIEPQRAGLVASDDGYALTAEFTVDLGHRVEDAVNRGLALYFNLEFELTRNRWYWANEHVAGHTLTYRLTYNHLTRQYRLATGTLYRNFDTLAEALRALGRVGALPVLDKNALKSGESYQAAVRLSLDRNQLPKPFQLDAFANRDWEIASKTLRWQPQAAAGFVNAVTAGEAK
ncbi:DUF4390 domain-containing protein [Denitratisoma sp. agr-D3]